ncbi:hypothetical protein BH09PAT2_BH09PAT2_04400 [soil metagenome]
MTHMIAGLFPDSKMAGDAISELKNKGYTKDISVITKEEMSDDAKVHDIKKDVTDGAGAGAMTGAAMGAVAAGVAALLVGAISFVIPGAGLIVLGPLAAGLTGAAAGAVTGGVVGALVDAGFPEEKAKMYQHQLELGDTLVSVSCPDDKDDDVKMIFNQHGASQLEVLHEHA